LGWGCRNETEISLLKLRRHPRPAHALWLFRYCQVQAHTCQNNRKNRAEYEARN